MSRPKITLLTFRVANPDALYPRFSTHITFPLYERYIFLVVACTDVRFKIVSSRRAAGPRIELAMAYRDSQQQSDATDMSDSDGDPHDTANSGRVLSADGGGKAALQFNNENLIFIFFLQK